MARICQAVAPRSVRRAPAPLNAEGTSSAINIGVKC